MEFLELAKNRYSCRKFKAQPIEKEKLELVLEAVRVAPTAANFQPCHYIIVQNIETRNRIKEAYNRDWILQAPVLVIACVDLSKGWNRSDGKNHAEIDVAIGIDHLTLAATDLGLATCWICNFNRQKIVDLFQLPASFEPVAIITLGYPSDVVNPNRHETQRKPLNEIVHLEKL